MATGEDYPRTLIEFERRFSSEAACRAYLHQLRWPDGFRCPACGEGRGWPAGRGDLIECAECHRQTSVTAGTIFEGTRKPLTVWFWAMWSVTNQKSGVSALGLQRTHWTLSSMPAIDSASFPYQRGKLLWHSLPAISREEVFNQETQPGEGAIQPLRLVYIPETAIIEVDDGTVDTTGSSASWAGIMRYFKTSPPILNGPVPKSVLEMRVRGNQGVLHFDLGLICEDIDGDGYMDTEDTDYNQTVSEEEDIGRDGLADAAEIDRFGNSYDPITNPDPAGDNWWLTGFGDFPPVPQSRRTQAFLDSLQNDAGLLAYNWLNGTEGNRNDIPRLGEPDCENLQGSVLKVINSYFSYHVNLESDSLMVPNSENQHGWRTYRVPIFPPETAADTAIIEYIAPPLEQMVHARAWLESAPSVNDTVIVEIADWRFVDP